MWAVLCYSGGGWWVGIGVLGFLVFSLGIFCCKDTKCTFGIEYDI